MPIKYQLKDPNTGKMETFAFDKEPTQADLEELSKTAFPSKAAPAPHQTTLGQQRLAAMRANLTAPAGQPGENPPASAYQVGVGDSLAAVESVVKPVTKFVQRAAVASNAPLALMGGIRRAQGAITGKPIPPPSKFEKFYEQEVNAVGKGAVGLVAAPVQLGVMGVHGVEDNARANRHADNAVIKARRGDMKGAARERALAAQSRQNTQQVT